jgi:hypothetical protein
MKTRMKTWQEILWLPCECRGFDKECPECDGDGKHGPWWAHSVHSGGKAAKDAELAALYADLLRLQGQAKQLGELMPDRIVKIESWLIESVLEVHAKAEAHIEGGGGK